MPAPMPPVPSPAPPPAPDPHAGHNMPAPAPAQTCLPEHAAMGHCKLPAPSPAQAPAQVCSPEHAAMGHCTPSAAPASAPATAPCPPEHAAMGHCRPAEPAPATTDPHAGHAMPATPPAAAAGQDMDVMGEEMPAPPVAPPPPGALSGPAHAADAVYGPGEMAEARRELRVAHGSITTYKILIDQLETRIRSGRDGYFLNAEAWYGGDINKLWLKSEIEGSFGEKPEQAEFQALWSHAIDPWFNFQGGVRYDAQPSSGRGHLVLGIQGLAPYWFEVDAAAFLSDKGNLTARFEAEYDQRLTRKLILQPRLELNFSLQDIPSERLGAGLSNFETGLRLRYEFVPEFAPYVGIEYDRALGDTARFNRAAGEDVGGWSLVLGVRAWF